MQLLPTLRQWHLWRTPPPRSPRSPPLLRMLLPQSPELPPLSPMQLLPTPKPWLLWVTPHRLPMDTAESSSTISSSVSPSHSLTVTPSSVGFCK
ncbi:hypothetical protein B7P43_G17095 [Cryptotermes secundus]|uniref:Uncharacterized protein n=1 Tax=Cryptotermes secundus TaxID=105785 RepID=A0A2J7Q411_9NEOP|nr:hypothetical protein B7P43_G17095 [Cryptotermes secundus]